MENLLDTGAGPNYINEDFLPLVCKEFDKSIERRQVQTGICKVVNDEVIVPLFVRIRDLHVRTWLGIVESLPVDVLLGTDFFNGCMRHIFTTEQKVVLCHLRPVATISTKNSINYIYAETTVFNENTKLGNDAVSKEHNLCRCRFVREISLP